MTRNNKKRILILGSGVIGLTTAIRLAENGHKVLIWSEKTSPDLTSDGSGGYWMPFHIEPLQLVNHWSLEALRVFKSQAKDSSSGCGVHIFTGRVLHEQLPGDIPEWTRYVDMRVLTAPHPEVPKGFQGAWKFDSPIVNMDVYMPWLEKQAKKLGVEILSPIVAGPRLIDAALAAYRHFSAQILVNCTGLGSRELCQDKSVIPGRGATVRVKSPANLRCREFVTTSSGPFSSNELPTYVLPRGNQLFTLGGTYFENDWNTTVSIEEAKDIQRRCSLLVPEMANAQVMSTWAGLRPVRPQVRLECEVLEEDRVPLVIHNYGHGGAGVTVSWGCAQHVVSLIAEHFAPMENRTYASRL
eukprot:jgi/Galph1/6050/GphlegSOOS_G4649.1